MKHMKHIKWFEAYRIPKPVGSPQEQRKIGIPKPVGSPQEQRKIGIPRKVNSHQNNFDLSYDRDKAIEELISSTDIKGFLLQFKDELISDLRDLYNQLDDDYLKAAHYINQLSDDDFYELEDDDLDMESYLNHSANLAHELQELNNKYLAKLKPGKPFNEAENYDFLHKNSKNPKPKKIDFSDIKEGDKVYVNCYTGMGASSEGVDKVTKVVKKYDEDTGEPYNHIFVGDWVFDSRNGGGIGKSMFYLTKV